MLVLFTAALLSKPIAVSLPITLLLLDYWPLARWWPPQTEEDESGVPATPGHLPPKAANATQHLGSLLIEKLPFFLLSGLACWVTVLAQSEVGAIRSLAEVPMSVRLCNSIVAPCTYLRKLVWPVDLAPIYPLRHDWAWWQVIAAGLLLINISAWVLWQARKRPHLLVGWCWYLVTLVPTLGLVQVGLQGMADRYTYVPLTGVFLLIVWEVSERATRLRHSKTVLGIGVAAVTGACLLCTLANARYWQASTRLLEHAVRVTKNNYIAFLFLGMAYENEGDPLQAEDQYRESLRIEPNRATTHRRLGNVLLEQGDRDGAFDQLSLAVQLKPNDPQAQRSLAEFLLCSPDARFHDPSKALEHARFACELSHYRKRDLVAFLAQVYAENHETQQAAYAAQKALALSVGPQEIQGAKELLATISRLASVKNEGTRALSTGTQ